IGPYQPVPLALGGAVERVLSTLAPYFVARGHEVTIVSRRFGDFPHEETRDGVRYIRIPSFDAPTSKVLYRLYDYVYSRRVAKILPASDVTITNSVFLPLLLPLDRAGHIYVHVARYPKRQMWLYRRASRIQAVSEAVAEEIRRQSPSIQDRVISIPNPLSGPLASLAPPDGEPRAKTILFVGRLAREKGVHLLIEAFARGSKSGALAPYRLHIVGPHEIREQGDGDAYLAELKSLAEPVRDRVTFEGPVFDRNALRSIFMAADIFVYPSIAERGEAFGVAPVEAMAARCRVVVSALECFREYVKPGRNALVFDHRANPVGALLDTLSTIVQDPNPGAMRDAAVQTASRFQPRAIADLYLQDFERVVRGEAPGMRLVLP
ncbi:glycosyltransferase family 4 protein, partial [Pseudorhodoplanes sp.]|uniref:glycosyltransferase family 4 protein n=1 Tax=Pseudorhodoplanes sp. TaxID=1934341 RepID=UPI003D118688